MTSRTSATANRRPAGFTLLELLVSIGIILLLIGILLPAVVKAVRAGKRASIAGQLQSISVALEQYKQDYNAYPQVTVANTGAAVLGKALMSPGPIAEPIGAIAAFNNGNTYLAGDLVSETATKYVSILANPAPSVAPSDATGSTYWKLAIATAPVYSGGVEYTPGQVVLFTSGGIDLIYVCSYRTLGNAPPTSPTTANAYWSEFNWSDGGDEQNYRVKRGSPIKRPYLQSGTFKMVGTTIVDRNDNPILYFPASSAPRNISAASGYLSMGSTSAYNWTNNGVQFSWTTPPSASGDPDAPKRIAALMGDTNMNGSIDANESAATSAPFVLWSAGPDGRYGCGIDNVSSEVARCDDVTNFR